MASCGPHLVGQDPEETGLLPSRSKCHIEQSGRLPRLPLSQGERLLVSDHDVGQFVDRGCGPVRQAMPLGLFVSLYLLVQVVDEESYPALL